MGNRADQEKIKELILTVREEYETFKTGMLVQSSDKVFENHAQIHFYCRLNDYFSRDISDFDVYEKREIRKLQQTAPKDTLSYLWDYYSDCADPTVESYLDIHYLIKNYNERYMLLSNEGEME